MGLQKTYAMKASEIEKKWFLIDAEGKILGRIATKIASILRGKHKPSYTSHLDMGDNVVVINAEKIVVSGNKDEDKKYYSHSHYPGGIKFTSIKKIRAEKPEFILEHAIKGMLPKTKLGKRLFVNLKIYKGAKHPHEAQKPEKLEV
jgi:large subunit ribosomal protein L13